MTSHSDHPFPSDIETMLREIESLGDAPMRWNLARPDFGSIALSHSLLLRVECR
jgi:hypothetical protein